MVILETTVGAIELELDDINAPNTVANFIKYVEAEHYDGTIFHRVIPDFMIQGGGFNPDMTKRATNGFVINEAKNGESNYRGTVAMARTVRHQDSASNQFFINLKDNFFLDYKGDTPQLYGYAVFGRVLKGMVVVDSISIVKTGRKGVFSDCPLEPVLITSVTIIKE